MDDSYLLTRLDTNESVVITKNPFVDEFNSVGGFGFDCFNLGYAAGDGIWELTAAIYDVWPGNTLLSYAYNARDGLAPTGLYIPSPGQDPSLSIYFEVTPLATTSTPPPTTSTTTPPPTTSTPPPTTSTTLSGTTTPPPTTPPPTTSTPTTTECCFPPPNPPVINPPTIPPFTTVTLPPLVIDSRLPTTLNPLTIGITTSATTTTTTTTTLIPMTSTTQQIKIECVSYCKKLGF